MTNPWLFFGLKIIILIAIYAFIFKVTRMILQDLKLKTSDHVPVYRQFSGMVLEVVESDVDGIKAGTRYPLNKSVSIGRNSNNAIQINDSFVSHEHARIVSSKEGFFIEDLRSRNGTILNGAKLDRPEPLSTGALLQIGRVSFKVVRWQNESS